MELLKQNELSANKAAALVMRVTAILFTLVLILDFVGIFTVDKITMLIAYFIGLVLLFLPTLIVNILKVKSGWVKYFTIGCAVVFTAVLASVLSYHVVVIYIYPVAIASLFFSTKLSVFTVILDLIGTAGGQFVCYTFDFVTDHNVDSVKDLILHSILPRSIILIAVSAILYMLCRRTASLLGSLMGAEKQKEIQEKSTEISHSMADMVSRLETVSSTSAEANNSISTETANVMRDSDINAESVRAIEQNMDEIAQSLKELSEMSENIAKLTDKAQKISADNDSKISLAADGMQKISAETDATRDMIARLEALSKKIAAITGMITDIATQTNILAINASIEASHAGEAGAGFSVVASQIKNLSEKTGASAEEIANIIEEVTGSIEKAAAAMDSNSALTKQGVKDMAVIRSSAEHISTANKEVAANIEDMTNVISNVFAGSETISTELANVSRNIGNNSNAVQQVAAAIEENTAATQTLDSMVKQIKAMAQSLEELTV